MFQGGPAMCLSKKAIQAACCGCGKNDILEQPPYEKPSKKWSLPQKGGILRSIARWCDPRVDYYVATVCWFDPILNILDDFGGTKMPGPRAKTKPHGRHCLGHVGFLAASPNSLQREGFSNSQLAEIHRWIFKLPLPRLRRSSKLAGHTANLHGTRLYVFGGTCSGKCLGYDNLRSKVRLGEVNSVQWTAGIFTPRKLRWQDGKSPFVYRIYIFKRLVFSLSC